MVKAIRAFFLSLTVLAFLLFSTIGTTLVYADDGTGTETSTSETTTTTGDEQSSEPSVEEQAATGDEEQPAEETPPGDEEEQPSGSETEETLPVDGEELSAEPVIEETLPAVDAEQSTEEAAPEVDTETILEQVPDNTTLTVLNSEGEALPLASQETAEVIASDYDPIWCPAGQVPTPGTNGCTQSFASFDELLSFLQTNEVDFQAAGTIYVQQGDYMGSETSIDFNNYNFNTLNQYDLTVQGGWDTNYDPAVNGAPTYTTTTFNVPIIIGSSSNPWAGSLTLNNISIDGVSSQTGLDLNSAGNIELNSVAVTNSQSGASLNAGSNVTVNESNFNNNKNAGAEINAGGNVSVTKSNFNNNGSGNIQDPTGKGLAVIGAGNVTLASIEANNNQVFGADINTTGAVTVTDSFFNGSISYTWWGEKTYYGYGIQVVTNSEVSLVNVTAEENALFGANITGKDIAIDTASFSNNGSGTGEDLTGKGLEVNSQYTVALVDVTASNNQLFGAKIIAGDVVAIAHSHFDGHLTYVYDFFTHEITSRGGGYGLQVVTPNSIALNDVSANNNYEYGASLEGGATNVNNSYFTANGSGVITEATGYGLKIVSSKTVTLTGINDADSVGNQLWGADIQAAGLVTIRNAFFSGHQSVIFDPSEGLTFLGYGLTVVTPDDIDLDGVTANFNNLWGASLTGNNVFVYNSQFNNNVSDSNVFIDDTGLIVNAAGYVDIYNVEAKENRLIGAIITAADDVFVTDSTFTDNRGFTCSLNWCPEGSITYHGYGLQVTTPGLIQVSGTNASNNNLFGATLNGGMINVEDSIFNNNGMGNGLTVNATDDVTLINVTASNNGDNGVDVTGVSCDQTVQVNGGTFSDNALFGLSVLNATLSLDGTQVFVNNGSGDFFANPCVVVIATPSTQPVSPVVTTNSNPAPASTGAGITSTSTTTPVNTNSKSSSTVIATITKAGNQITSPTISKNANWSSRHIVIETIRMLTGYDIGFLFWEHYRTMWDSTLFRELWQFIRLNSGFEFDRMILPW